MVSMSSLLLLLVCVIVGDGVCVVGAVGVAGCYFDVLVLML